MGLSIRQSIQKLIKSSPSKSWIKHKLRRFLNYKNWLLHKSPSSNKFTIKMSSSLQIHFHRINRFLLRLNFVTEAIYSNTAKKMENFKKVKLSSFSNKFLMDSRVFIKLTQCIGTSNSRMYYCITMSVKSLIWDSLSN